MNDETVRRARERLADAEATQETAWRAVERLTAADPVSVRDEAFAGFDQAHEQVVACRRELELLETAAEARAASPLVGAPTTSTASGSGWTFQGGWHASARGQYRGEATYRPDTTAER